MGAFYFLFLENEKNLFKLSKVGINIEYSFFILIISCLTLPS